MKIPDFIHIITFIVGRNSFVSPDDIISNQILKTGKSKGIIRLYVYTTLNRLKKRGQITSIEDFETGKVLWGLPGWTDFNDLPLSSHMPLSNSTTKGPGLLDVNPKGIERKHFVLKELNNKIK